jgi:hypothetical protein
VGKTNAWQISNVAFFAVVNEDKFEEKRVQRGNLARCNALL